MAHSALSFARPLHMRAPVLAPAGFNHHQHTGQLQHHHHQHGRSQAHNQNHNHNQSLSLAMADPAYMASDEEMAHLQKLSSEYEPEASVSLFDVT
jgi:ubiquitin thioesterase protein OTUB1